MIFAYGKNNGPLVTFKSVIMKKRLLLIALMSTFGLQLAGQSTENADSTVTRDTVPAPVAQDSTLNADSLMTDSLRSPTDSLPLVQDSLRTDSTKEETGTAAPGSENEPEETTPPEQEQELPPPPPPPKPPKTQLGTGQFQVLMVKGAVTNRRNGQVLKQKSILNQKDPLQFSQPGNRLALIDERKQGFIARPRSDLRQYDLQPFRAKFDTRPGKILNYIAFVKYLEGRDFLVLGGKAGIEVGREEFPMDQDHFFYIQYNWTGDPEPVNKKLSHEDATLYFDRSEIYQIDNRPVDPSETQDFKLFYYDAVQQKSTLINSFAIVFPDEPEVRTAVQILIDHFGTADRTALLNAIENFLIEEYGVPEKQNLAEWLRQNFGLVVEP